MKWHKNPLSWSRVFPGGQTDGLIWRNE